jgi:hypothetical protein
MQTNNEKKEELNSKASKYKITQEGEALKEVDETADHQHNKERSNLVKLKALEGYTTNAADQYFYGNGQSNGFYEGRPYFGNETYLELVKDDDPAYKKPQRVCKAHIETFNLLDEEQVKRFERVCDLAVNGQVVVEIEERKFIEKEQSWVVFMRWYDVYMVEPNKQIMEKL